MNASTFRYLFPRHGEGQTYTPAEQAEMLVDPYDETPKYARASVGFICGVIAIAGFFNLLAFVLRTSKFGRRIARSKQYRRMVALYRWIETSQPKALFGLSFPTWGTIGLIAVFWAFVLIWSLAVWPYYRSRWNVGSPPLAMRTGLFALGCFPFILAFGAKWNVVGFVVGCSHEKLQVYHQWLSHLFLVLSFLHTFPFVVAGMREVRPNTDGTNPDGLSQIAYSWQVAHKVYYWSGTAALICLCWLCWGSIAFLRNRCYELWKLCHLISAVIFSWAFYVHCNALLGSWDYLWATAILYLLSVFMRFGLLLVRNGHRIPTGHVEALADNAIKVTVRLPQPGGAFRWAAGQHYFVNFFKILPFESHPYTVANVPFTDAIDQVLQTRSEPDELHLVFRINPTTGLGPRLLRLAQSANPTTPVLLDGPYGGLANRDLGRHETVVLIAGGAGFSYSMALLEDLTERTLRGDAALNVCRLHVHWAVRNGDAETWFFDRIERCARALRKVRGFELELNLYVTGDGGAARLTTTEGCTGLTEDKKDESSSEKSSRPSEHAPHDGFKLRLFRPDFASLLDSLFAEAAAGSTVGIGSCGPASLTTDVRRAVGAHQWQLARGKTEGAGEIELATEVFDW